MYSRMGFPGRPDRGLLGHGLADASVQFVVEVQEELTVERVPGKADDVGDIPHHPVGEKQALHLAAAIGDPLPVHPVNKRKCAVIVPIEHGSLCGTVLRQFAKVAVLRLAIIEGDLPEIWTTAPGGLHVLGPAAAVFLNEFIRRSNDLLGGTVVLLHIENFCLRINGVKLGQRLRIGGPEAIDALVLIAHHEEIPALSGQQANDRMLDLGGVLGFIHAKIPVSGLDGSKDIGILAQNLKSVDHLIVIIH